MRALYLVQIAERSPYFDHVPEAFDQHNFYAGAKAFARGDPWAPSANEMYSALYKYALGALWRAAGALDPAADEHRLFWIARGAHLFLAALAAPLLCAETRRYFSGRAGVLAGLLYAVCGPVLFHEALLSREYPAAWLSLVSFWAVGAWARRPTVARLLAAAAVLSLAYQCRTNAILFLPAVVLFAYRAVLADRPPVARMLRIGAAGLLFAALCLPLAWRTSRRLPVTNPPPPGTERNAFTVSAQGPFEVALGNHPDLTVPGYRPTPEAIDFMEKGPLTTTGMVRRVWTWFRADPIEFARLYMRKIYWFFSDYEVPDNHSFYVWRYASLFLSWPTAHAAPYAALALVGAALAWPRRRQLALPYLFALSSAAMVILTYVCSRFRIQAMIFWIPFAAFALDRIWEALRTRAFAAAAGAAAAAFALFRLFSLPEPESVLRALRITERHAPEAQTGEILFPEASRDARREQPFVTTGVNRTLDLTNLIQTCLYQAHAGPAAARPERAERFRRQAEEVCRKAWNRAVSLGRPDLAPAELLARTYAFQWNAAAARDDPDAMVAVGDKWLRLAPAEMPLALNVALVGYSALVARGGGRRANLERAAARLRRAALLDPRAADAWAALLHLAVLSEDAPAARFFRERLAALDGGHTALAAVSGRIPEPEEDAATAAERARRLEEEGDAALARGDAAAAARAYGEALARDFGNAPLRHKRAAILFQADPARACADYETLLLCAPEDPDAHIQMGLLLRVDDPLRATWHLERALAAAPQHPMARNVARGIRNWPKAYRPD